MKQFLLGLTVVCLTSFSVSEATAGGAFFGEKAQYRKLKREQHSSEQNGGHAHSSATESIGAGHGAAGLPGTPTPTPPADGELPPATPDLQNDNEVPAQIASQELSPDQIKAAQDAFCGNPTLPNGGPLISLFFACYKHSSERSNVTAAQSFASLYNAEFELTHNDPDKQKRANHKPRFEAIKAFRHQILKGNLEMMRTRISDTRYSRELGCNIEKTPPKARLSFSGLQLSCDLAKNSIGKQDCTKDKIVIRGGQGDAKKLCP